MHTNTAPVAPITLTAEQCDALARVGVGGFVRLDTVNADGAETEIAFDSLTAEGFIRFDPDASSGRGCYFSTVAGRSLLAAQSF